MRSCRCESPRPPLILFYAGRPGFNALPTQRILTSPLALTTPVLLIQSLTIPAGSTLMPGSVVPAEIPSQVIPAGMPFPYDVAINDASFTVPSGSVLAAGSVIMGSIAAGNTLPENTVLANDYTLAAPMSSQLNGILAAGSRIAAGSNASASSGSFMAAGSVTGNTSFITTNIPLTSDASLVPGTYSQINFYINTSTAMPPHVIPAGCTVTLLQAVRVGVGTYVTYPLNNTTNVNPRFGANFNMVAGTALSPLTAFVGQFHFFAMSVAGAPWVLLANNSIIQSGSNLQGIIFGPGQVFPAQVLRSLSQFVIANDANVNIFVPLAGSILAAGSTFTSRLPVDSPMSVANPMALRGAMTVSTSVDLTEGSVIAAGSVLTVDYTIPTTPSTGVTTLTSPMVVANDMIMPQGTSIASGSTISSGSTFNRDVALPASVVLTSAITYDHDMVLSQPVVAASQSQVALGTVLASGTIVSSDMVSSCTNQFCAPATSIK